MATKAKKPRTKNQSNNGHAPTASQQLATRAAEAVNKNFTEAHERGKSVKTAKA